MPAPAVGATSSADHRQAFERDVERLLQGLVTKDGWAGNVAIAYDGRVIVRAAYGIADKAWQTPARVDAVYRIGSTSKMMTAVAILQLVQAGKVSLDASVRDHLPDMPAAWQPVTIRHLLRHASGLADYLASTSSFRTLVRNERTPDEILALVKDTPLKFAPGSKYEYSNTNYIALGAIIEKASGKPYGDYVVEKVLRPAGMAHSGYFDDSRIIPFLVPGYLRMDGTLQNMFHISPGMIHAAGNLYATADDLLRWDHALHDSDVLGLSPGLRAAMFEDAGHGYGYGAFIDRIDGETAVGHGGTLPGYQVAYERFTRLPLTIVLMTNVYQTDVDRLARNVARLFFQHCGKEAPDRQCELSGPAVAGDGNGRPAD